MANDLVISVGASIKDLERQMAAAAKVAAQRADEIEREFAKRNPQFGGRMASFGLGAIGGIAGAAAANIDKVAAAFTAATKEIASFASTSKAAGIELERFQQLRYAAGSQGISGKEFDTGVQGLAKALNESRREETELSKFLDANNVKIRDRRGEILSTNQALSIAADLVQRAATEMDKIEIAKKFGLPPDFVPLLERGSDALNRMAKEASTAGAVLDRDVIEKAAEFDRAWDRTWNNWIARMKASIAEATIGLGNIVNQALEAQQRMANAAKLGARMGRDMGEGLSGRAVTAPLPPTGRPEGFPTTAPYPPSRPPGLTDPTRFASSKKGGGSGGGKSDQDKRSDEVERYISALERANRVLAAEEATLGRSKAERAAAIELARIGTVTDEAQKQKIVDLVAANERYRESIDRTKQAQKDLNEAGKYFGSAAVDALEDMIVNGAKAEDVMKRLAASLVKAALQAALLGEGPLGGIFGIIQPRSTP